MASTLVTDKSLSPDAAIPTDSGDARSAADRANLLAPAGAGLVLCVDDDNRHLDSLCALLEADRHHAIGAPSIADAKILLSQESFDVVLLDLRLQGESGADLLQPVTAMSDPPKVVLVTSEDSPEQVSELMRRGVTDYIRKPYSASQLLHVVNRCLRQKRLDRETRALKERFDADAQLHQYLVENSPDVIYTLDERGHFTFINQKAEQILSVPRSELLHNHWSMLFDELSVHDADHHFNERRTGERATRNQEIQVSRRNAHAAILELSATGIYQHDTDLTQFRGTYGVARDVTERKQTASMLAESEQRFLELFHLSPDPILISRISDGSLVEINEKAQRLLDALDSDGQQATNTDAFLWKSAAHRSALVEQTALPDAEAGVLDVAINVDDEMRVYHLNASRVEVDSEICLMSSLRDISSLRHAEDDRMQLEMLLNESRKMISVGQIAGGIAHDFNNILASMIGFTELAMLPSAGDDSQQQRKYLKEVVTAGRRARDLIAQLLSFSRTNRSDASLLSIAGLLEQVTPMLKASVPSGIAISVSCETGLPQIYADQSQLLQVIINLLVNARDSINGRGRIGISAYQRPAAAAPVQCSSCQHTLQGGNLVIEFTDDGCGVPEHQIPGLFELFGTAGKDPLQQGIGLALVHRVVHEYNGHIELRNNDHGQGTTIALHFPCAVASDEYREGHDSSDSTVPGTVLVVDDEVSVSGFVAETLRRSGHHVVVFNDAPGALDYARQHLDEIDLCVTDQTMPQMTGLELAHALKVLGGDLPVVLITGYSEATEKIEQDPGVDGFLSKPFRMEELSSLVRSLLQKQSDEHTKHALAQTPDQGVSGGI